MPYKPSKDPKEPYNTRKNSINPEALKWDPRDLYTVSTSSSLRPHEQLAQALQLEEFGAWGFGPVRV